MNDKPLKAYLVMDLDGDDGTLQWATTNVVVRREGDVKLGVEFSDVSRKRNMKFGG